MSYFQSLKRAMFQYLASKSSTFNISTSLTNCTGDATNPTTIASGGTETLIFTADSGYVLPQTVTVTGATYTWEPSTGVLDISNPTGNVSITITSAIVDATFANNSWYVIKAMCIANTIPSTWAVGDTKTLVCTDNNTYNIRLTDKQQGRYSKTLTSLTGVTNAVFEFVELPNINVKWKDASTNDGGYNSSDLRDALNTTFVNLLPAELRNLLDYTAINSNIGASQTGSSTALSKLFALQYGNLASSSSSSEGTVFDYYDTYTSYTYKLKTLIGTSTKPSYWIATADTTVYTKAYCIGGEDEISAGSRTTEAITTEMPTSICWAW